MSKATKPGKAFFEVQVTRNAIDSQSSLKKHSQAAKKPARKVIASKTPPKKVVPQLPEHKDDAVEPSKPSLPDQVLNLELLRKRLSDETNPDDAANSSQESCQNGSPDFVSTLGAVTHVLLDREQISSMESLVLHSMPAVTNLYLQHNRLTSLDGLGALLNLRFLTVSHNHLTEVMLLLSDCAIQPSFTYHELGIAINVTGTQIFKFCTLVGEFSWIFSCFQVSGIVSIENLMFLDVSFNHISELQAQDLPASLRFLQASLAQNCPNYGCNVTHIVGGVAQCLGLTHKPQNHPRGREMLPEIQIRSNKLLVRQVVRVHMYVDNTATRLNSHPIACSRAKGCDDPRVQID